MKSISSIVYLFTLVIICKEIVSVRRRVAYQPMQEENIVKAHIQSKDLCIEGDEFELVREDSNACQLYVNAYCQKEIKDSTEEQYVANKYGLKRKVIGDGPRSKVYMFQKNQKNSTKWAVKKVKNYIYTELFLEINASICLKKNLSQKVLNNMGVIEECIWIGNKRPLFFMKFFEVSLETYIKKYLQIKFSKRDLGMKLMTIRLMKRISTMLGFIHEEQMAHQDMRPSNIMLNGEGIPNLIDFGKTEECPHDMYEHINKAIYMDYEMMNNTPGFAYDSDMYSLGLIFYEMVRGADAQKRLVAMISKAGVIYVGNRSLRYMPEFRILDIPSEFSWIMQMLSSTQVKQNPRWNCPQVLAMLDEMLILYEEEDRSMEQMHTIMKQELEQAIHTPNDQSSINMTFETVKRVSPGKKQGSAYDAMMEEFNTKTVNIGKDQNLIDQIYMGKKPIEIHPNQKKMAVQEITGRTFKEQAFDLFKKDRGAIKKEKQNILLDLKGYEKAGGKSNQMVKQQNNFII